MALRTVRCDRLLGLCHHIYSAAHAVTVDIHGRLGHEYPMLKDYTTSTVALDKNRSNTKF
jgi:hypothetical protein